MAIDFNTLPDKHPIYSFVGNDGVNIHIDSPGLRNWCIKNRPEVFLSPTDPKLARTFVRDNVVSPSRVIALAMRFTMGEKPDPIIYCKSGTLTNGRPDVYLVDGHHRFYILSMGEAKYIKAHLLEVHQWKPFQVVGVPKISQDFLRNMPILPRDY